jgi:hypothetical protein
MNIFTGWEQISVLLWGRRPVQERAGIPRSLLQGNQHAGHLAAHSPQLPNFLIEDAKPRDKITRRVQELHAWPLTDSKRQFFQPENDCARTLHCSGRSLPDSRRDLVALSCSGREANFNRSNHLKSSSKAQIAAYLLGISLVPQSGEMEVPFGEKEVKGR